MSFKKLVSSSICTAVLCTAVSAQESKPTERALQQSPNAVSQNLNKLDSKTSGPGIRASKLMGMKIQNSKKENVGQIKDIVLDPATTRIQYVAVTYGGFLGLGDKLFAVPIQAIHVQQDPDHQGHVLLVMDVTKEQMNGAKGFDESNWPNFSDSNFAGELHRRYNTEAHWNSVANPNGKVDVKVARDGVKVIVDKK